MSSIALGRGDVVVGVDTHKDEHVAVALNGLGGRLDDIAVAATTQGYEQFAAGPTSSALSRPLVLRALAPTALVWPGSCAAGAAR